MQYLLSIYNNLLYDIKYNNYFDIINIPIINAAFTILIEHHQAKNYIHLITGSSCTPKEQEWLSSGQCLS